MILLCHKLKKQNKTKQKHKCDDLDTSMEEQSDLMQIIVCFLLLPQLHNGTIIIHTMIQLIFTQWYT